jgi:hypothetical protein
MTNHTNFYHLGFSKCGTSSIWQFFHEFQPTKQRCLKTSDGRIEFDLRRDLQDEHKKLLSEGGCYLKYSSAAFGSNAIRDTHNAATSYGTPVYLLSIRSQFDVLISWYNMHKRIALEGTADHFAVRERDKYLNMSIEEYADIHLPKLDYAQKIANFASIVRGSPIWVLDFRLADLGVGAVMGDFLHQYFKGIAFAKHFPRRNIGNYSSSEIRTTSSARLQMQCSEYEARLDSFIDGLRSNGVVLASPRTGIGTNKAN